MKKVIFVAVFIVIGATALYCKEQSQPDKIYLYPVGVPDIAEVETDFTVVAINEGLSFEKAGIQKGDVIKKVNGRDFETCVDLLGYILGLPSGQDVVFEVEREGVEKIFNVSPRDESPRYGFSFRIHAEKRYYEEPKDNASPPRVLFAIGKVKFFLSLTLTKSGIVDCEATVENYSDEKVEISPDNFKASVNNKPLNRLSAKKSAKIYRGSGMKVSDEDLNKIALTNISISPEEAINKKLWFHNKGLNPNIEVEIKLGKEKTAKILFDKK